MDDSSLVTTMRRELKLHNFSFDYETGIRKNYNKSDRIFYSLGDSFEASYRRGSTLLVMHGEEEKRFRELGFRHISSFGHNESFPRGSTVNVRNLVDGYKTVIGVEPNGLLRASEIGVRHDNCDAFDFEYRYGVKNMIFKYMTDRWKVSLSLKHIKLVDDVIDWYRLDYTNMFKKIKYDIKDKTLKGDSLFRALSGYSDVSFNSRKQMITEQGYKIRVPKVSESTVSGKMKNDWVTKGLIQTHDYYILISDLNGMQNKDSKFMNPKNTLVYNPNDIEFSSKVTHYKQLFTRNDIPDIVNLIKRADRENKSVLIRIDMRGDKPTDFVKNKVNLKWENVIHEDNLLIQDIVNATAHDNVTISAKMRPAFNDEVGIELERSYLVLPIPYTMHSTSEFMLYCPKLSINKKLNKAGTVFYEDLVEMGYETAALKVCYGHAVTMALNDLMLWLGVSHEIKRITDDSIALYSISNTNNAFHDIIVDAKTKNDFLFTMGYSFFNDQTFMRKTRGRVYLDHNIDFTFEINNPHLLVAPVTSLGPMNGLSFQDLTTVFITDRIYLIDYSQPAGIISTQYVKLISFMLKSMVIGIDKVDDALRAESISKFNKVVTKLGFKVGHISPKTVIINEKVMTVSGHMLYIICGTILGVPYGLRKYLSEIEFNINYPNRSYERNSGSRVWHGFFSHLLGVLTGADLARYLLNIDIKFSLAIDSLVDYMIDELTKMASKYPDYLTVDERDQI